MHESLKLRTVFFLTAALLFNPLHAMDDSERNVELKDEYLARAGHIFAFAVMDMHQASFSASYEDPLLAFCCSCSLISHKMRDFLFNLKLQAVTRIAPEELEAPRVLSFHKLNRLMRQLSNITYIDNTGNSHPQFLHKTYANKQAANLKYRTEDLLNQALKCRFTPYMLIHGVGSAKLAEIGRQHKFAVERDIWDIPLDLLGSLRRDPYFTFVVYCACLAGVQAGGLYLLRSVKNSLFGYYNDTNTVLGDGGYGSGCYHLRGLEEHCFRESIPFSLPLNLSSVPELADEIAQACSLSLNTTNKLEEALRGVLSNYNDQAYGAEFGVAWCYQQDFVRAYVGSPVVGNNPTSTFIVSLRHYSPETLVTLDSRFIGSLLGWIFSDIIVVGIGVILCCCYC